MNKYDSFEIFMVDVVNKANSISNLNDLFDVQYNDMVSTLTSIIKMGWWVFIALCALLALGPIGFGLSVGSFLLTPPGLIIAAALGLAAAGIIRHLYHDKELPRAIKKVGERYEQKWKAANGNTLTIDNLFKNAVSDLLYAGKHSLSSHALDLLSRF